MPGTCSSTRSSALFGTNSKLSMASPNIASRWRSNFIAASARLHPDPGDRALAHRRHQLEARRGDDAERPFGADQQLAQIVAAIVLLERGQPLEQAAVGQHRFEPKDERPHGPEAQHLGAAGIGRDQAADRRRAARAQGEREAAPLGERAAPGGRRGSPRPRRPRRRRRRRGCGSGSAAASRPGATRPTRPASPRRPSRCCRPAAPAARRPRRRRGRSPPPRRLSPATSRAAAAP